MTSLLRLTQRSMEWEREPETQVPTEMDLITFLNHRLLLLIMNIINNKTSSVTDTRPNPFQVQKVLTWSMTEILPKLSLCCFIHLTNTAFVIFASIKFSLWKSSPMCQRTNLQRQIYRLTDFVLNFRYTVSNNSYKLSKIKKKEISFTCFKCLLTKSNSRP